MFYFRSTNNPYKARPVTAHSARWASALTLVSYPPGAFLLGLGEDPVSRIAGAALLIMALFGACFLVNTSVQRIVGEQPKFLDEYEMQLRLRAMQSAYAAFTLLVLLFVIYLAIASDARLWVPSDYGAFNGIFWGTFLYAWVLPTLFVAWRMDDEDDGDMAP